MTDQEALVSLLDRFGLTPYAGKTDRGDHASSPKKGEIILAAHEGGIEGYGGFYAIFVFDDMGKFLRMGIFE